MGRDFWSAEAYQKNAAFVPKLTKEIVQKLALTASDVVLDLGCGDGVLTRDLASQCKHIIGIDSSSSMIQSAKEKGLEAYVIPGENLAGAIEFPSEGFDAVFSNAALHWILRNPNQRGTVFQGIARVLRPGGRFVAECGVFGNVSEVITSIYTVLLDHGIPKEQIDEANPWYFGTEQAYTKMLKEAGFEITFMENVSRPTYLDRDVRQWLDTFAHTFYDAFPDLKETLRERVYQALRWANCTETGDWYLLYRRLRFVAVKN
ncbi:methyltransferase [Schizosaccharomyces cryophilus OY26]|uniref:Methyltransferase n=1 Tax=Schizosaccharomyces cryophilus (strain OY26 / ATCC MYA-4695 / CBS 11777 / NBRC 106824 / NRRL Y48691) TaxID=653667 RepID=S9VQ58_SCHCR|nr:methyltransferase [Schizosaccharomyces cryophilus OY26]EPY50098.1 methyltransferase [Schizosaccharomyces cryophilus OY26]